MKWEYLIVEFKNGKCCNVKSSVEGIYPNYPRDLRDVDAMGYVGNDGWELVSVLKEINNESMYFKRMKD